LTTQKRENQCEYNRVDEYRIQTGLTRPKNASRPRGEGKKKTGAEYEEERSAHDKVVAGENETHGFGDETVHQEEHQRMEEYGHLTCFSVHVRNLWAVGSHHKTGTQRHKKGSGYSNFLGSKVWGKHLIYAHIFFVKVNKVVESSTTHHLFMESIINNDSS